MSFLQKWSRRFAAFMNGRNGMDQLAFASFIIGVIFQVCGTLLGSGLLLLLSLAAEGYTVFRVFSQKSAKRAEENQRFFAWWREMETKGRQFLLRLKLRKQYKYFKCPQCGALLRMNRGEGEKEICCPRCKNRFQQKS